MEKVKIKKDKWMYETYKWSCPKCILENHNYDLPKDNYVKCHRCGKKFLWEKDD